MKYELVLDVVRIEEIVHGERIVRGNMRVAVTATDRLHGTRLHLTLPHEDQPLVGDRLKITVESHA